MMEHNTNKPATEKILLTPGPLSTSPTVKQAMLRDLGSRDAEFINLVSDIRSRLLCIANAKAPEYTAIPMQGSGTFGVEAVIGGAIPSDGRLMVAVNGLYGERMTAIARRLHIPVETRDFSPDTPVDPKAVAETLAANPSITHVAVCHCETTTGVLNNVEQIGQKVRNARRTFIVDAMSTFGALPVDLPAYHIDYLVTSSNKCLQGVPGFAIVLARLEALQAARGCARGLSLDSLDQHENLEAKGQFRFTPPTHAMLALQRALLELEEEGGEPARGARYAKNQEILSEGMRTLGFKPYLGAAHQSPIITSFYYPDHPNFDFNTFYAHLSNRGFVIYPGKLTDVPLFRVGSIGHVFPSDMRAFLDAVHDTLKEMNIQF